MKTSIDSVGRIVVPKPLRALGFTPGSTVDGAASPRATRVPRPPTRPSEHRSSSPG